MNDLLLKTPRLLQGDFFAINKEMGFSGGSDGKASVCSARDLGLIPGGEDPLEKEMTIYSSIIAWRIPWMEEPGGLQSKGSQRVGHD